MDRVAAVVRGEARTAAGDDEAGGESLEVPLEGPRQGLVEVVDVEDRSRSGDANSPKFDRWASPQSWTVMPVTRRRGKVGGHRQGRPR